MFFILTDEASTIPSNIRGCHSGTWSAGQEKVRGTSTKPQRVHENKTKQKRQKERNNNTKHMPKKIEEGHSIERVGIVPAASHPLPSPDCNHAPKRTASTIPYSQGFSFNYRHSRRRVGSPRVGPINASLKRLKLVAGTPGATSTLSASSASLFLCRCSDAFYSFFTHAAINLQPSARTMLYQAPGSSVAVLQSPVIPNSRRSSATQSVHSFSFPPAHVFPRSPAFPT